MPPRVRQGVFARVSKEPITFEWDGEPVEARAGEPIACALWRAGIRVQTRSIKYHRARGPQCLTGDCPGCMVRVDGVPNRLGCRVPVQEGMEVESQVGIPSAKRDVLSIVDRVLTSFDHERDFVRPGPVRAVYQAVARRLAGFGTQPTGEIDVRAGQVLACDVLVVGGGPAGLSAARAAAEQGADVIVVDEDGFGGQLTYTPNAVGTPDGEPKPGSRIASDLIRDLDDAGVQRVDGSVVGLYEDATVVSENSSEGVAVHMVEPEAIVLAVGGREGPVLVDGSDRPGVLGARAARILLNRWEVAPGDPVALVDPGRHGEAFAREAGQAGLDVRRVETPEAFEGDPEVTGVRTPDGHVDAEAVVVDPGIEPAPELGRQAGIPYTYEAALGGRVPLHSADGATPVPDVLVAGSCAGLHDPSAALVQGRAAGARAAGNPRGLDEKHLLEMPGIEAAEREALERLWRRP